MKVWSESFSAGGAIPPACAFGKHDPESRFALSDNRSPHIAWSDVPEGAKSLVLICHDTDVPSRPDEVNQEGKTVPADLPRVDFYHWVMVDVPADCRIIDEGACSSGVTAGGKDAPSGPRGSRQGRNDYTAWFSGDADMGGDYQGYDGPAPPWNDTIMHHYHFKIFATDLDRCPVDGVFGGADVLAAIEGHVLAEASIVGTYTLNPNLI